MAKYKNPEEVLERVEELREAAKGVQTDIAMYGALGVAYAHGKHWKGMSNSATGDVIIDQWDENWDIETKEIRVVDNKIGPLLRKMQADLNPTRIEAEVITPRHLWGMKHNQLSNVAEKMINGIEEDAGFTRAAKYASFMRCIHGSYLIVAEIAQKTKVIAPDIALNPDGTPVEVNDQWLRWTSAPLTDLVWDPSNTNPDLAEHDVLMLDQIKTVEKFEAMFGPVEQFGIDKEELPTVEELAPYYSRAADLTGTSLYLSYSSYKKAKAIRFTTLLERDPRDPTVWDTCYFVLDTSSRDVRGRGKVLNFNNPKSPFGHHGRHIHKLDCFPRSDSVSGAGAPHVMMTSQDLVNMLRSIQFQAISAQVHGQWLVDKQTVDPDEFMNKLNSGTGSVLQWDSRGPENRKPPQMVNMGNVDNNLLLMANDLINGMKDQVHLTGSNMGIGKTHVPQQYAMRLMEEAGSVKDLIIQTDVKIYSDLLKVTLGTLRKIMDKPNRMLKRLIDLHGITPNDLKTFSELQPSMIKLTVRAREKSITQRSLVEREQALSSALQMQTITPQEYWIGMATEIKQPILDIHDKMINWCNRSVEQIVNGEEWQGVSAVDPSVFKYCVNKALMGLDYVIPQDREIIERLNRSIIMQFTVSAETQAAEQAAVQGGQQQQQAPQQPEQPGLPTPPGNVQLGQGGGAPESINPQTNPIGAAGGLPLGLSS